MKRTLFGHFVYFLARIVYPKSKVVCLDKLTDEPAVFVANHSKNNGSVMMTLYFSRPHTTWIINNALDSKKAVSYAYHDVFLAEGKKHKKFYIFVSKVVAKLLPKVLKQVDHIPVYHSKGVEQTFSKSIDALNEGKDIVIFAESPENYSPYINKLQPGFVSLATFYYQSTGKRLKFYPVFVEKKNRQITIGTPIEYNPNISIINQSITICEHLQKEITNNALSLKKKFKPVPFLSPQWYETYKEYTSNFVRYWNMIDSDNPEERIKNNIL